MRIFRRQSQPVSSRALDEEAARTALGDRLCSHTGCGAVTGVACEYVDRRGRACETAWCPVHRAVVGRLVFCRRHAGVVSSLPASASGVPLPDLDNRAPSLVSWVAREVDADVRELLQRYQQILGGRLMADQTYLVFTGVERRRAWERVWKLVVTDRQTLRVSLLVEEGRDSVVVVKVGSRELAGLTPPWIVNRERKGRISIEDDTTARRQFNERILQLMRDRVAEEVAIDRRGGRQEDLQRAIRADRE